MKKLSSTLGILALSLAAVACDHVEGRTTNSVAQATVTRSWPVADLKEVRVFEVEGSVSVEPADDGQITLVAKAKGDFDIQPNAENKGLFETSIDGDTLSIGRKKEHGKIRVRFFFDLDDKRIDYELRVPRELALRLTTVNGKIATRGIAGETEVKTVNGTIDVETAGTHELYATTVNGKVRARFLESFQGARFKTVNGGVEAALPQNASFEVDLSQVNGDFEAAFPLSIHSNPGSRRVSGEVNGGSHTLKISTVNGDVVLDRL